jgi:hypothetical protein
MKKNESIKYLSLKATAQMYGYTRDHLGLMIRQGKLKGMRLGSYYVTTSDWMAEYIKEFANPNHPAVKSKLSNKFMAEILSCKNESLKESATISEFLEPIVEPKVESKTFAPVKPVIERSFQNNSQNEFEKLIFEDLSYFKPAPNKDIEKNQSNSDSPYMILPIRKMRNDERMKIIERVNKNRTNNDWEDDD